MWIRRANIYLNLLIKHKLAVYRSILRLIIILQRQSYITMISAVNVIVIP